ncbi:phosphatidylserine decarboxylase [Texas Phoenix palm phytoplasma]|uniref:Phosphatidylserine decarboxylase n=1 Tax=Texas Phoenix palm phytoplasma TaxID=176709 RepID=A0ABS5BID7_9MOLU|nr:phosphatidylserine decarboxylase [Texas Phoenix palm phytoplasma]MBP3059343.1 phosphatidylserine decarboxylase [Texas Phoenix palm phytoplasma]
MDKKKDYKSKNFANNNQKITSLKQFFLYSRLEKSFFKRVLLKILISRIFTLISGIYLNSFFSKIHIKKTIKSHNINLNLFEKKKFNSYNDFFIRKYKKLFFSKNPDYFISPGEGEISIYSISSDSIYTIKDTRYHLSDILKNDELASSYKDGNLIILRLKPSDYHRYIFVDDGIIDYNVQISGKFHTVNPIAFKYFNVFKENNREYSVLKTKNFSEMVQVEIGALMVGKINNHPIINFSKGQEKGFFSFGGSTILLLVKKNIVSFEREIYNNTLKNIETKVNIGQKIGKKIFYKSSRKNNKYE